MHPPGGSVFYSLSLKFQGAETGRRQARPPGGNLHESAGITSRTSNMVLLEFFILLLGTKERRKNSNKIQGFIRVGIDAHLSITGLSPGGLLASSDPPFRKTVASVFIYK